MAWARGIRRRLNGSTPSPWLFLLVFSAAGCNADDLTSPAPGLQPDVVTVSPTLAGYFPPPETAGGWRTATGSAQAGALGVDSTALAALGQYAMALPWENHHTGVSGYDPRNKASLVIKNGWIVGEYYNQPSARTALYDLASNSKTFAIMLMGKLIQQHPELGITLSTP